MQNFALKHSPQFDKDLKEILRAYPHSENSITTAIQTLCSNPAQGDRYPGLGFAEVRKIRIPLKEYNIGKSKGLRIIYFVAGTTCIVLLVYVYQKTAYRGEAEIISEIKKRLKQMLERAPIS